MVLSLPRRRFTTDEYHKMVEAGILTADDRVELIDGEILEMSPIGPRHAAAVKTLNRLFSRQVGDEAMVGVQDPILLEEFDEPEPDLSLLRPRSDAYRHAHPRPNDIYLLIEVADASLLKDRQIKIPRYAKNRIREVWLVDLTQGVIVIYRDPSSDGYRTITVARRGEVISPLAFPNVAIPVADILG